MFKLSGEKLNFSSGMASTTSSICFSIPLISRSTAEAMVGGAGGGCCCACVALAAAIRANVRSPGNNALVLAIVSSHGIQQLLCVVPDAIPEHDFDVFDVRDAHGRIAFHHHEVRVLPDREGTDLVLAAEENRSVQSRDPDRLDRREAGLDQQL